MNTVIMRLKSFKTTPTNGLAIFCGLVATKAGSANEPMDEEGGKTKMRKVIVVLEPLQPVKHNLYHCDSRFHVEQLLEQLDEYENSETYGFIIVDGNGALFGKLHGSTPHVLTSFSVSLPKKHNKGGQSSERFARLRENARHQYIKSVAEKALKVFIDPQTTLPNTNGVIIAGSANIKDDLVTGQYLDERLARIVFPTTVVVAYGGIQGFHQAIAEVQDTIRSTKFVREMKIISDFMHEVSSMSNKAIYGVNQTIKALEMGIVSQLIVIENLPTMRATFRDVTDDSIMVKYLHPKAVEEQQNSNSNLELIENVSLLEHLVEQYDLGKLSNVDFQIVSDKTMEGRQLMMGFGGIAGILRYPVNMDDALQDVAADSHEDYDLEEFF